MKKEIQSDTLIEDNDSNVVHSSDSVVVNGNTDVDINTFIKENSNIICKIIKKYNVGNPTLFDELMSIGLEELWNCSKRYKEGDATFGTYSWVCIIV